MFDTAFQGTDKLLSRSMRVLLSIANPRDRELLAEQLRAADLEVVTVSQSESLPQFDLCVAGTSSFPSIATTIRERRDELGPVRLPVLLVLGPDESEQAAQPYWDSIDDVLGVPTTKQVFQHRVASLLSSRRQSEQLALFARAMEDARTGIVIADAGGDEELRYVNDAFLEITGYDRDEVLGKNCRFLQGPETEAEPVRKIRRAIDEQRPTDVLLRNYTKDGEMFWNALKISPVYGEDEVTHFVGFQDDVTERVERTRILQRYEELVSAAGDPIYALDEELTFTLLNDATAAFCAKPEEEILGTHVSSVFGTDHAEVLGAAVLSLTESDTDERTIGTVAKNTDGQPRQFQTTLALLSTEEFQGVVCVSRDITEARERESRLSVLDRVLRHNLRNKLMVMMAQTEQIKWRSDDSNIVDAAATIEKTGEELLDLAETAREFKQTVDPADDDAVEAVDIGAHIRHVVEEARLEYQDVTIALDVPTPLWATAHDSFELAMSELLERAATAGEDAAIAVDADANRGEGNVVITVRHDGESPPEVELEALNSGVESALRHTQGLGLWFVRWMAVNSGGRFHIANVDSGVEVELQFPLAEPPAD